MGLTNVVCPVGASDSSQSSSQMYEHTALLLSRIVEASPQAAVEVHTPKSMSLGVLCECFAANTVSALGPSLLFNCRPKKISWRELCE